MSSTFGNKPSVIKDLMTLFWKCSLDKSSDFKKRKPAMPCTFKKYSMEYKENSL